MNRQTAVVRVVCSLDVVAAQEYMRKTRGKPFVAAPQGLTAG